MRFFRSLAVAFGLLLALIWIVGSALRPSDKTTDGDQQPNRTASKLRLHIGEKGIVKPYTIGCHSEKEYDKLSNLLDLGDKDASKNFMVSRVRLGVCRTIMEGGEAVVEKVTFSSNKICVRKAGDIDCLWVDRLLVQKKNNASLL
jgi:hypothetical protein